MSSTRKCYFCSGPCEGDEISATIDLVEGQKKVWFCSMICWRTFKYGFQNDGQTEEPNVVY
jgi:hypothetical protein